MPGENLRRNNPRFGGARVRLYAAVLLLILVGLNAPTTLAAEPSGEPEFLHVKNAAPRSRAGIQFEDNELTQHKLYERRQTLAVSGEYAFADYFSLHAALPWTRQWITDTKRQTRFDNMRIGAKFGFRYDWVMPYGGLAIDLPTGSEEQGIGSKELGNLEPYGGLRLGAGWFYFQVGARYNTQTNKKLRETDTQEFRRFYLLEAAVALSFSSVDLLVEYSYMRESAEQERPGFSGSVVAPGINIKPSDHFVIGLGATYALSREREFDYGYKIRLTYLF